jgi:D-threo-aldose 1-dehydrogenase
MREPSRRRRQELLASAFEHGITHFDVARMYGLGAAEAELGRFLRSRRDQLTIASKFGIEPARSAGRLAALQGPARALLARSPALRARAKRGAGALDRPHRYDVATARRSLETSLRELRTDYLDMLFLHGPSTADAIDLDGLGAFLEDRRSAGQIRAWGLAGAREECRSLARRLPDGTILQLGEDIFSRETPGAREPAAQVVFGILVEALPRIAAVRPDTPSDEIASLLLADALQANPSATVLFSTTRPARLAAVDRAAVLLERQAEELVSFRERLGVGLARAAVAGWESGCA